MNRFFSVAASAVLLAALAASSAFAQTSTSTTAQDAAFVNGAVEGGLAEVSDGKLALAKSKDAKVDAFAQRMVSDHSKANDELAAILRKQNITSPAGMGAANESEHQKLASLAGAAFDSAYLAGQKTAHQQTIALFKAEIATGQNPALVGFAKATLPTLQAHLAMLNA